MSEQDVIFPDQLLASLFAQIASSPLRVSIDKIVPLKQAREIVETELIVKALKEYHSLRRTGEILGVAHSTLLLLRKARALGISYTD